ncbi:MAG TPA: OsmC family protein [Haliangiales bacterium]|nr:OsmC family protein [Haliangiales bacterium]
MSETVVVRGGPDGYRQEISDGRHVFAADEPVEVGGTDAGPGPYGLLLASLGACTSMTLQMYARRKGWPLEGVTVTLRHERIYAKDCEECETEEGMVGRIHRDIAVAGPLTEEQRQALLAIAGKCPVHRTLTSEIVIRTQLV